VIIRDGTRSSQGRLNSCDALDYEGLRALLLPQCFHGGRKCEHRPVGRYASV
jgi:hypothetical protein